MQINPVNFSIYYPHKRMVVKYSVTDIESLDPGIREIVTLVTDSLAFRRVRWSEQLESSCLEALSAYAVTAPSAEVCTTREEQSNENN